MATRSRSSVRSLQADDAPDYRQHLDADSQAVPEGSVELQPVHECLGGRGDDSVHSLPTVAQLAAGPVLGLAGVQRTETKV